MHALTIAFSFVLLELVKAGGNCPTDAGLVGGELWCARAEGATYSVPPSTEVSIAHPDGSAPEGCRCIAFATPVHDWIAAHQTNGTVVIDRSVLRLELGATSPLPDLLLATRDAIYDAAVRECLALVPPIATASTCDHPARFDAIPATPAFEPRELHRRDREPRIERGRAHRLTARNSVL